MLTRLDQSGWRLVDSEKFKIDESAQPRADVIAERTDRQRIIDSIDKVVRRESGCGERNEAKANDSDNLHATPLAFMAACLARRKRTSNSVQFSSERISRKSPPCSRASSRARFKPRPWPVTSSWT